MITWNVDYNGESDGSVDGEKIFTLRRKLGLFVSYCGDFVVAQSRSATTTRLRTSEYFDKDPSKYITRRRLYEAERIKTNQGLERDAALLQSLLTRADLQSTFKLHKDADCLDSVLITVQFTANCTEQPRVVENRSVWCVELSVIDGTVSFLVRSVTNSVLPLHDLQRGLHQLLTIDGQLSSAARSLNIPYTNNE